ncbi:hypothetical protein [Thermomonas paludicola]|uniref:hypothetical protein n=1 Tax=Thermomonas paludicola TaxID=2884874 RepID=UPI002113E9EF|nr:hypothetical protein [Thermomonas paludicola]
MNRFARWAKRIATLLLLASFFLPLSRCASLSNQPVSEDGTTVVQGDGTTLVEKEYFDVHGYDLVSLKDWPLWLLAFTWPLMFQVLALTARQKANSKPIMLLEALLLVFSAFQISYLIYNSDAIRYGALVAYSGLFAYIAALVMQLRSATPNNSFKPSPLRGLGRAP